MFEIFVTVHILKLILEKSQYSKKNVKQHCFKKNLDISDDFLDDFYFYINLRLKHKLVFYLRNCSYFHFCQNYNVHIH